MSALRVGLIVPSSNTTMETELPEIFARRAALATERLTFHSARMPMTRVTPEALAAMDAHSGRCARDLADADCDVLAYACLVAVMAAGPGAHVEVANRLAATASTDRLRPVVTSAGALVEGIRAVGADRVALVAPYEPSITRLVVSYLADQGIEVVDAVSLGVRDNCAVGRLDPEGLIGIADRLDIRRAEAIVLSACVQMPSLPAIPVVEARLSLPVLSAATATAWQIMSTLGVDPLVPDGGALLSADASSRASQ